MRGSRRRLEGQRRPTALLMTISSPSSGVPDGGLARRAVGIGRGDDDVALVVEEGSDVIGKAEAHTLDGTRAARPDGGRGLPRRRRLRVGPAEEVALSELDVERGEHREVRPAFDAFGEEVGADPPPERDERLDQRLLGVVVADAVDDLAVDLDDRRAEGGDQREAGVAGTGVVDREPEAELAQRLDLALERADVGDRLLLGAFDGDVVRVEAGVADPRPEGRRLERRVEQAERRQVDRVAAGRPAGGAFGRLDPADVLEHGAHDVHVQLHTSVRADRGLDDRRDRLREHRHVRAEQALVLVQLAGVDVDDRLERDLVQLPEAEEVVEHLGLDDLGRLGHADPLGEAGQLDRGGHRDEVAVALGQGLVERDQAVLGPVGGLGDLGGERVGQGLGRADQDDARIELEHAPAFDERSESAHEPDVARPEEPFRRGSARRGGQEPHAGILRPAAWPSRGATVPVVMVRWSGAIRWGPVRSGAAPSRRQALRRSPARIGRSRRFSGGASGQAQRGSKAHDGWNGEVEVDDERAARRVATEVGALGRIDEVAAGGVRLLAVRAVAERDEEAARVARHPEDRERARAGREGERDRGRPG